VPSSLLVKAALPREVSVVAFGCMGYPVCCRLLVATFTSHAAREFPISAYLWDEIFVGVLGKQGADLEMRSDSSLVCFPGLSWAEVLQKVFSEPLESPTVLQLNLQEGIVRA